MTHKYACQLDGKSDGEKIVVVPHSDAPWEAARRMGRKVFGYVADDRVTVKYLSSDSRTVQIQKYARNGRRREMERVI